MKQRTVSEKSGVLTDVMNELSRAETLHPDWPDDAIHAAAVVGEEAGDLIQAALQFRYEGGPVERMREEAVQVAAMGIRFLLNLPTVGGA